MRRSVLLALLGACATPQVRPPDPAPCHEAPAVAEVSAVREAVHRFVAAVEKKEFDAAFAMLDGAVRRRYSAERLQHDFAIEPRGALLVGRAKAAAEGPITLDGDHARLEVAEQSYAVLHFESGAWHLVTLDAGTIVK